MKRRWFLVILAVVVIFGFSLDGALARDDWQYWNNYGFSWKLNENTSFLFNPSMRLRDDFSELYYYELRQGAAFKVGEGLELAVHYLYADNKSSTNGKWADEHRLEIQPTLKWEMFDLDFSDRNRLEYKSVNDKEKWRYRNQLKVTKPVEIGGFKIKLFTCDEIFYDFKKEEVNQNRMSLGVSKKLTPAVDLDLYYMLKSDRSGADWSESHVIGTKLKFSL